MLQFLHILSNFSVAADANLEATQESDLSTYGETTEFVPIRRNIEIH